MQAGKYPNITNKQKKKQQKNPTLNYDCIYHKL